MIHNKDMDRLKKIRELEERLSYSSPSESVNITRELVRLKMDFSFDQ